MLQPCLFPIYRFGQVMGIQKAHPFRLKPPGNSRKNYKTCWFLRKTNWYQPLKSAQKKTTTEIVWIVSNPNITESKSITESWKSEKTHKSLWNFSGGAILVSGKYTVDCSEIRRWPVEGTLFVPWFTRIYRSNWWLFGISEPSTVSQLSHVTTTEIGWMDRYK